MFMFYELKTVIEKLLKIQNIFSHFCNYCGVFVQKNIITYFIINLNVLAEFKNVCLEKRKGKFSVEMLSLSAIYVSHRHQISDVTVSYELTFPFLKLV